jgi:hypothetical protein
MNGHEKSDKPVVPARPVNASETLSFWELFERVQRAEGRGLAKENGEFRRAGIASADPAKQVDGTQRPVAMSEDPHSALDRIRQAACRDKEVKFTSLWHHVYDIV